MAPPPPIGIDRSPGSKRSSAAGTPRTRGADPSNPTNLSTSARAAAELRLSKPTPRGDAAAVASIDLVKQAQARLKEHEVEAQKKHLQLQTKKERIEALLTSAIEVLQSNGNEANCKILEQAIEVAQVAQVLPELRVKARKLLETQRSGNTKAQHHEQMLLRLVGQLEASRAEEREQSIASVSSSSSMDPSLRLAKRRHHEKGLLKQLAKGIADAPREGVPKDVVADIEAAMRNFEEKRRLEAKTEVKLRSLLYNEANVQELAEQIEMIRERPEEIGPAGNKLILEIEDKIAHSMEELRHQQWLRAELKQAADASDLHRLQMLARQAQSLELRVPPWVFKLLDESKSQGQGQVPNGSPAEASSSKLSQQPSADGPPVSHNNSWSSLLSASDLNNNGSGNNNNNNNGSSYGANEGAEGGAKAKDPRERLEAMATRAEEDAQLELDAFNWDAPRWSDLLSARRAVELARESRLPPERFQKLQQELTRIDTKFGRRLEAEDRLETLLKRSEQRNFEVSSTAGGDRDELALRSDQEVSELRLALEEGELSGADHDLVEAARGLLERSLDVRADVREAGWNLRQALSRPIRTEEDFASLREAIDLARHCGLSVMHAERELAKCRHDQVQREATEAELLEASKGHGRRGRERLEEAIQQAKRAGVAPERLKQANEHLRLLLVHEERSSLAAGNIRRLLEKIPKEPWRLQQVMDLVKPLRPLTQELERLVEACHQEVQKQLSLQSQVQEITAELRRTLDTIQTTRTSVSQEDFERLADLVKRARSLESSAQPAVARTRGQHNPRDPLPPQPPGSSRAKTGARRAPGPSGPNGPNGPNGSNCSGGPSNWTGGGGSRALSAREATLRANGQVPEALVEEGEEVLKSLRRDRCQRDAAEHRLQLAMKARNQGEIEHALRAVRALGPVFASPSGAGSSPTSNRLIEEAGSLLQQLGEGQARKKAALENLQECLKRCANPLEKDWFENAVLAIQEAKHCGVPATILDQAKREVRTHQRQHEERALACEDLQRSLAQSQTTPQQVLMKLRKVQRLGVPLPELTLAGANANANANANAQ